MAFSDRSPHLSTRRPREKPVTAGTLFFDFGWEGLRPPFAPPVPNKTPVKSAASRPRLHLAVRKIVARAGRQAGIAFPIHPHMLRHATRYKLANDGQGHHGDPAIPRASGEIDGWDTGLTN